MSLVNKMKDRTPSILGSEKFSKFSVLVPIVEIKNEPHVLFEVRSLKLRRQPGEICFPGGKYDQEDRDELHTAVRETSEELGIEESSITHVSPLDYMISPFGTIIYPYMGVIKDAQGITPNPMEVGEIFTVPISYLLSVEPQVYKVNFKVEPDKDFPIKLIPDREEYKWQIRALDEYFYFYEDRVIWGLTARILKHFLEIVK